MKAAKAGLPMAVVEVRVFQLQQRIYQSM
jgi:hypothetical protein